MAELKNEFAWSFSRHRMLLACPRQYHFRHHAFWGGWDRAAPPEVREIYRLTKLEHRPTWQGKVVHEAIARALWRARRGRPVEDVDAYVESVLGGMRQDYRDSLEDRARATGRFKDHVRFFEHEERIDDGSPAWRARWKDTAETVEKGLRSFFRSKLHAALRRLSESDWIEIEDPTASVGPSFDLDGVKVHVKVDCAFREAGRAVVVDWKTGQGSSPATPVQLATYALYLARVHGVAPASVTAREVNVVTGTVVEHAVGEDALATFRDVFRESVALMRSYLADPAANLAKPASAFPFAEDERECRTCNFRSVCPRTSGAF